MDWPPTIPKGFPLTVTDRGYYKRIAGKPRWICGRRFPDEALRIYHHKAGALMSGAKPMPIARPSRGKIVTLHYVLGRYLQDRRGDVEAGGLSPGAYAQYKLSGKRIDAIAGHIVIDEWGPDATKSLAQQLSKRHGPDFARRAISHLRTACREAAERRWCRPVLLGEKMVSTLTRQPKAQMNWRLYTPHEIHRILIEADRRVATAKGVYRESWLQLRAMIYLALNGGFGAQELADLGRGDVDLGKGEIVARRGKTGATHAVPLWPETIAAIEPCMLIRPTDPLLFRTRAGNPWCYQRAVLKDGKAHRKLAQDNAGAKFRELVTPIGLHIAGQGLYKLKHLASTVADAAGDPHATYALFGHALPGSKAHYVRVGPDRVRNIVEYMRQRILLIPSTA